MTLTRGVGPVYSIGVGPFYVVKASKLTKPFRAECGEVDVSTSGIEEATFYRAGISSHGRIAALSGFRPWNDDVEDPCVVTHPSCRGCGYGAAVMSMTADLALANGKMLLCQTLDSNTPAVRLSQRLARLSRAPWKGALISGCEPHPTTVASVGSSHGGLRR